MHRHSAFTLAEVMFAVLVLGIGLISVAALFPAAAKAQQETMNAVQAEYVLSNADAVLRAKGINEADLLGGVLTVPQNSVTRLTAAQLNSLGFPISARVYPSVFDTDRDGTANEATEDNVFQRRQYYWEPLIHRDANDNWTIFLFVQRRLNDTPLGADNAFGTADDSARPVNGGLANAGDYVVNATTGAVTRITDDTGAAGGWHSPVIDGRSTAGGLVTIRSGVIR